MGTKAAENQRGGNKNGGKSTWHRSGGNQGGGGRNDRRPGRRGQEQRKIWAAGNKNDEDNCRGKKLGRSGSIGVCDDGRESGPNGLSIDGVVDITFDLRQEVVVDRAVGDFIELDSFFGSLAEAVESIAHLTIK